MKTVGIASPAMLMLCMLLLGQLVFWPWSRWITRDLVDQPLDLDAAAVVERGIRIPLRETYELSFVFARHPGDGEDTRAFLDGAGYFEGRRSSNEAAIPIAWSLTDIGTGQTAASGTTSATGASNWSDSEVYRHIAYVKAPPGRYGFRARILQPVPELRNAEPRLTLALAGHDGAATWQLVAVFWGSVASLLLVLPLMAILCAVVLWQARPGKAVGVKNSRSPA